jgi:hypothetical protein
VIFALAVFSMVAMLVRVCILCSFVWSPGHGLLNGSLNEGVSSISEMALHHYDGGLVHG